MAVNLLDVQTFASGHPDDLYRLLRDKPKLHWNSEPNGPGFWAVTRYEDVYAVDHDFQTYSSEPTIMIEDPLQGAQDATGDAKMMLMMDPPDHTAFRKLIRSFIARIS